MDAGGYQLIEPLLFRNRKVLSLDSNRPSPRSLAPPTKELPQTRQHRLASDYNLRALDLFVRLGVVAKVGKENAPRLLHKKQTRAPGKAAEIPNIRKMTDEERIEPGGRKMLPQFLLSPLKIHCWKVYQERKGFSVLSSQFSGFEFSFPPCPQCPLW